MSDRNRPEKDEGGDEEPEPAPPHLQMIKEGASKKVHRQDSRDMPAGNEDNDDE